MATSIYLQIYTELAKKVMHPQLIKGEEFQHIIYNYLSTPRSADSVKLLNNDYRTIEYDNIDEYREKIEASNAPEFYKNCFHFINQLISYNKVFYVVSCNKPTWVRYNKTHADNLVSNHPFTIEPYRYIYYTYYLLKVYRACINNMIIGIKFIFSEECRNDDIKKNKYYYKGRDYFLTAADAALTMINELILVNALTIKSESSVALIPSNIDIKQDLMTYFISLLNIDIKYKKEYENNNSETMTDIFKNTNKKLYFALLSILNPCDFNTLCNRLWVYHLLLKNNIYVYQIINNMPNPEYLGNFLKINSDIEC